MAMICWSFVMVLFLTLAALIAPSQPLFQPPAGPSHTSARELETASTVAIEDRIPNHATGGSDVEQRWNVLVGRRGRFRRLVERGNQRVNDQQLDCRRKARRRVSAPTPIDSNRLRSREMLAKYRLPQMKRMAHLESDRMVPTGPNPLHNSNRSQVIFPWPLACSLSLKFAIANVGSFRRSYGPNPNFQKANADDLLKSSCCIYHKLLVQLQSLIFQAVWVWQILLLSFFQQKGISHKSIYWEPLILHCWDQFW